MHSRIRNFAIISHIDHGKSTLADRFLELTGTVEKRKMRAQFLDQMELEREKGITIKLQPVRMLYEHSARIDADQNADERGLLYEDLTYKIRGLLFNIYNKLGPSYKENIYGNALEEEFQKNYLPYEREKIIDVIYGNKKVGVYKPDFIIDNKIILEIKAQPFIGKLEIKQTWHYLKSSHYRLALLVNFGSEKLQIKRIVYDAIRDYPRSNSRESAKVEQYVLNLIDTPGHVDFAYEVSRSLAAVEGAILLVDGTQGIQAQTLANLHFAQKAGLKIIGAINKIDLEIPNLPALKAEISRLLGASESEIALISGKTGEGVGALLDRLIREVPAPEGDLKKAPRGLIFDSHFDPYKGVIAYVRIFDGQFKRGDKMLLMAKNVKAEILEAGVFRPQLEAVPGLGAGEIGYLATGIKDPGLVRVGETVTLANLPKFPETVGGYREPQPVVFASFYPENADDYENFREALKKLKLNDAALAYEPEFSEALGRGFRLGFLGMLHLEIGRERLKREYGLDLIITTPSVAYKVTDKTGKVSVIYTPQGLADSSRIETISEPWVKGEILLPSRYAGPVMTILKELRTGLKTSEYLSEQRMIIVFEAPLSDIIVDFYDRLKSFSEGYASMSYEIVGERPGDLVKIDILVAGEPVEAFSRIVSRDRAQSEGRRLVGKLKEILPKQAFAVSLQAAIGGKIIAREDISAMRKDVTGYLYGGDYTRKRKLLEKQKRGKKRLKKFGRVEIPHKIFLEILKK